MKHRWQGFHKPEEALRNGEPASNQMSFTPLRIGGGVEESNYNFSGNLQSVPAGVRTRKSAKSPGDTDWLRGQALSIST